MASTPMTATAAAQDAKRAAILAAASAAFAEEGFAAATIGQIAVRAGIGKGTVYEYFRSKEELLLACCLGRCHGQNGEVVQAAVARWPALAEVFAAIAAGRAPEVGDLPGTPAILRELIIASVDRLLRMPQRDTVLFVELSAVAGTHAEARAALAEALTRMLDGWQAVVRTLLDAGMRRGDLRRHPDPDAYARMLITAIDGMLLQQIWRPPCDPAQAAARLADAFLAPLLPGA